MPTLFTIGTDTELFGRTPSGDHVALCGKIGGTKDEPMQIHNMPMGFALQEDNVAVEFNIPPAQDAASFNRFIEAVLVNTNKTLGKLGLTISDSVAVSFDMKELMHPRALMFGCDPDHNAWTGKENPRPVCDDVMLRTAGGHIHVGTDANMVRAVQMMDLYLGVPSILLDESEGSNLRRKLYGKAGAMRPKSYGLEYRVLSNWWVFTRELREWVFNNTWKAVAMSGSAVLNKTSMAAVQNCINRADKSLAKQLISKYEINMPAGYHATA